MLNEILLDALSFFDYSTLVVLQLTNKQLLRFVDRYAELLAFRRTFTVSCTESPTFTLQAPLYQVSVAEVGADNSYTPMQKVDLDASDNERIIDAAAELQSFIGPHAVLEFALDDIIFSAKLLVDRIPALRHAFDIQLEYADGFAPSSQEYTELVSLFERPGRVEFWEISSEALLGFLQSACASQLKQWSASAATAAKYVELNAAAQENIIFRSCFDFTNVGQDEPKKLYFVGWNLRWDFLRRLIEASDDLQRPITIEVSRPNWIPAERLELGNNFALSYWRLPLDPAMFE